MRISILALAATAALAPALAQAAPWHKAYVFDWFEPAMYYAPKDGVANPGPDCPLGTMPDNDWRKMLKTAWRTDADVAKIMNPEGPSRQRDGGLRGPAQDISIYSQPWTLPDPGLFEIVGATAEGFDLDGNAKTGFTSPDGKVKGIDNAYYKALGCLSTWRGPPSKGHHQSYVMEGMHNGQFAVVMVVSGEGADPANDPTVKVAFYTSMDKIVRDAGGQVAGGYTFRVNPAGLQHVLEAKTVGGVIQSREPTFINIRSVDNVPMKMEKAHMRLEPTKDGGLAGFMGGYRSVADLYSELAGGAATFELTMRMNTPAVWYALQRNADYKPDASGKNTMMSMAYRYSAKPAHVITPDAREVVTVARLIEAAPAARAETSAPRAEAAPRPVAVAAQ